MRLGVLCVISLSLLVAACGGGGGGDSGGGGDGGAGPDPVPVLVSGQLRWIGTSGWADPAPAGQTVEVVALRPDGTPGATIAGTTTGADGAFELAWPAGRVPGDSFVIQSRESDGATVRALGFGARVELGAASEVVTRAYLAARRSAGGRVDEPAHRLQRWQTASTQFLTLTPLRSRRGTEAAVTELARWHATDPASAASLAALRNDGRLPASLADIGGLQGASIGAWEAEDSDRGRHQLRVKPRSADGSELASYVYEAGADGRSTATGTGVQPQPVSVVAFLADTVAEPRVYLHPSATSDERFLRNLLGPLTHGAIGVETGQTQWLMRTTSIITEARPIDPFPIDTRFEIHRSVTVEGIERVVAFGDQWRALRSTTREILTASLPTGEFVETESRRIDWSVPFAGPVRSTYRTTVRGTGIETATQTGERTLLQGVTNGVSWPGRLLIAARPVDVPAGERAWWPLGVTPDRGLVLATLGSDGPPLSAMVIDVDTGGRRALREFDRPAVTGNAFAQLSPDGRKLYAVHSVYPSVSNLLPIGLAQADRVGALVERFDATDLGKEMSMRMPAQRSRMVPGTGHPRYEVRSFIVSPTDPTVFVASSVGAVLVRGSTPAPAELFDPGAERDRGLLIGGNVRVWGWDGPAGEIRASVEGADANAVARVVPVRAEGIPLEGARVGFFPWDVLSNASGETVFADDRLYFGNLAGVFDKRNGALLGRNSLFPCTLAEGQVVCPNEPSPSGVNRSLVMLDAQSLAPVRSVDLQVNLRWAAGQAVPEILSRVDHLGDGELVAADHLRASGSAVLYRIAY